MSYTIARGRLVQIFEAVSPPSLARGLPPTFKHFAEAHDDQPPPMRGFYIVASEDGESGIRAPFTPGQGLVGQLMETTVRASFWYDVDADVESLDELIEADRIELQKAVAQAVNYQPDIAWITGGDTSPLFRARRKRVAGRIRVDLVFTIVHR